MPISKSNFRPGVVLYLDARMLANDPGTTCSVARHLQPMKGHFFVCIKAGTWVPVYSRPGPGRIELDSTEKGGHIKWTTGKSHYHTQQYWTASDDAVALAQHRDHSSDNEVNTVTQDAVTTMIAKLGL
ncbi:hypothetical protein HJC22_18190 [Corallococcus exiguus]|uniref:hypothetical protein n=1 Tax=Corallococcus exiguus TaxID=83462 RepID=UPI00147195D9|nr:hypothetical protein [Corallococcus exiguus]NNC17651.1 hypothetical protein [Corallococcus exiguus]